MKSGGQKSSILGVNALWQIKTVMSNPGILLRAYRKHLQVDPLYLLGTADLAADVNFKYMKTSSIREYHI